MKTIVSDIPAQLAGGYIGVQVVYFWTRSTIVGQPRLRSPGGAPLLATLSDVAPERNGTSVLFRWPKDAEVAGPLQVVTDYLGEPMQVIITQWIRSETDIVNARQLMREWVCCRQCEAQGNEEKQLMLDIDLNTNEYLLPFQLHESRHEERMQVVGRVSGHLYSRLVTRAGFGGTGATPVNELAAVADLFRDIILRHFHDIPLAVRAFERFALGALSQACPMSPLLGQSFKGGDVDSANVFLFAEMALAVIETAAQQENAPGLSELWRERADFWIQFVNVFVRMQSIYLARWPEEEDPKCFNCYGKLARPPSLARVPRDIADEFEEIGQDIELLRHKMKQNLDHTIIGTESCKGQCCFEDNVVCIEKSGAI